MTTRCRHLSGRGLRPLQLTSCFHTRPGNVILARHSMSAPPLARAAHRDLLSPIESSSIVRRNPCLILLHKLKNLVFYIKPLCEAWAEYIWRDIVALYRFLVLMDCWGKVKVLLSRFAASDWWWLIHMVTVTFRNAPWLFISL